jgi:hypothetical protein
MAEDKKTDDKNVPVETTENQNLEENAEQVAPENSEEAAAHAVEPTAAEGEEAEAESAERPETAMESEDAAKFHRLKRLAHAYWARKKWTLPVTALVLLILLLAIPLTRYPILGVALKKDAAITVLDSTTDLPVTDADVAVGGKMLKTDNHGHVVAHLGVGKHAVSVTKKYYKTYDSSVFVGIAKASNLKISAVATGRQVPIAVTDYVTGRALENAVITANGSSAKTDKKGKATLVLPAQGTTAKATISRDSYNNNSVSVTITAREVNTNKFTLTPSGKVYFLSNLSGKIDVVKTDLDGKNRKTVLAGTGSEDTNSTSLLASRDWKYLALLSKRDGKQGIYLIDTATDKSTNIDGDSDTATFTLVGWSGDTFVYQVQRSNVSNWQSGAQAIKSYDAANGKLYTIDQSQGEGTGQYDYGFTNYSTVSLLDNEVVYAKNWYSSQFPNHLSGKSSSLVSVHPDGSSKKTVKDFPIPAAAQYTYFVSLLQYESYGLYVQVPSESNANTYYAYEDGNLTAKSDVTDDTYNKPYPTFLVSPSGKQTFWSEVRDNKNALFIGNNEGASGKQIATLSEYTPYGWYTDNYLLVSKGGSELYIMAVDGSKAPVKMTDYYKPQLSYRGYGGGYGGI